MKKFIVDNFGTFDEEAGIMLGAFFILAPLLAIAGMISGSILAHLGV